MTHAISVRGSFDALIAVFYAGIAAYLIYLAPQFSWLSLSLVVLFFSLAGYFAVAAYYRLSRGINLPSAAWFIRGFGYILVSLLLSGGVVTQEISGVWLLAVIGALAFGLLYLKAGRDLRRQNTAEAAHTTAQEIPARTARIVWAVILLSHALILCIALTVASQVYPNGPSTWVIAFLAICALLSGAIAHRRWQKTSGLPLTTETYVNYLVAWVLGQAISVYGLALTFLGTPFWIWVWFPLAGFTLSVIHRLQHSSSA